jgi:D-alanine-D-alanine ligase
MKKRVGVIFGGRSGEHEVAIRSAKTVIEQIDREKYTVIPVAITKEGNWLSPAESSRWLPSETISRFAEEIAEIEGGDVGLVADTRYKGLKRLDEEQNGSSREHLIPFDVVFPVLHGTYGEDGTVQGLLEMAGIPYVGCGVLASACGMDKVVMKTLFRDAGLPICKYTWFLRGDFEKNPDAVIAGVEKIVGYPCFVKPANLGSSVGVSRADDSKELTEGIRIAADYDRKIIVEEALEMREIECAVLGNDSPEASRPGEYIIRDSSKAFLDYTEKYSGTGNNEFVVPAPVSPELEERIMKMAVAAFKAVDASGLGRVDFFLRNDNGALLVNEINTMPGLTDASGYPKMWAGSGKPFSEVIDTLISLAFERYEDRVRNKTSVV